MEYTELGPVPAGESCAQVGTDNYLANSMRECEVYRRMLARVFRFPKACPSSSWSEAIRTTSGPTARCPSVSPLATRRQSISPLRSSLPCPRAGMSSPCPNSRGSAGAMSTPKAVREGALPGEGVPRFCATNRVPQLPSTARDRDLLRACPL